MNELIDAVGVLALRDRFAAAAPDLAWEHLGAVAHELGDNSLRARTDLVSAALLADVPDDDASFDALVRTMLKDPGFAGWTTWPVGESAVTLALRSSRAAAHEDALHLLAALTPRLTSEFAIRRLLAADLHRSLDVVRTWTTDADEHVRRLASEGTRAFLPWATRVPALLARPDATIGVLDALYRDPSEYVRRSVANHLNDLSRLDPALVVSTASRWASAPDANTAWVVRHGLRTLIKKAHPGALALLGFAPATVTVAPLVLERPVVTATAELAFTSRVTNDGADPVRLAIDYVVHLRKKNGSLSEKVFKLGVRELVPGATAELAKRHSFRPITTRVYHPGEHAVELQVNGVRHGYVTFDLQP